MSMKRKMSESKIATAISEADLATVDGTSIREIDSSEDGDVERDLMPIVGELCVFESSSAKRFARAKTWFDDFEYNMSRGNSTVIYCDTPQNNLDDLFAYCKNHLNLNEHYDKLYPRPAPKVCIEKAVAPRIVNQVGLSVQGGLQQFYFYDKVNLKLCTGKHGPFLKLYWSRLAAHNRMMANLIAMYRGWEPNEIVKMQTDILVNVPTDFKQKQAFVSKFFDIHVKRNAKIFKTGISRENGPLVCDMFSPERFDKIFEFNYEENNQVKPSNTISMTMYALLEGFKVGKEKELNTVYNKTISAKPYSVAVQPLCFFHTVETEEE
ncbi:DBP1 protein [Gynaephora ruoergensis nucleopolyhedrovirus]|nr:DBP1 protein [Gynaephora ruoergensis nucleopolyhedrovirus]